MRVLSCRMFGAAQTSRSEFIAALELCRAEDALTAQTHRKHLSPEAVRAHTGTGGCQGQEMALPALTCKPDPGQFGNELAVVGVLKVPVLKTAQTFDQKVSPACPPHC